MICNNCGRNIEKENVNFCENCGMSFRDAHPLEEIGNQLSNTENVEAVIRDNSNLVAPVTFGNWMGSLLLPFIPLVGPIIYFVMLFIWSFGPDANRSKKNWARAQLIVSIVVFVLFIYIMTSTVASGTMMEEFKNML